MSRTWWHITTWSAKGREWRTLVHETAKTTAILKHSLSEHTAGIHSWDHPARGNRTNSYTRSRSWCKTQRQNTSGRESAWICEEKNPTKLEYKDASKSWVFLCRLISNTDPYLGNYPKRSNISPNNYSLLSFLTGQRYTSQDLRHYWVSMVVFEIK